MKTTVKERLIEFIKTKNLSQGKFEKIVGLANGYVNNIRKSVTEEKLQKIALTFPELNKMWLLTGEGDMLIAQSQEINFSLTGEKDFSNEEEKLQEKGDGIPYYKDLLVTAGKSGELALLEEIPSGFINLPDVSGRYCFPVIGCSMEPEIHAGEIVVADDVNSWDKVDPDKVYLIVTHEDRMIKHLEVDQEDDSILWCVSPNYRRFSIMKNDIKRIFKITFHGRLI